MISTEPELEKDNPERSSLAKNERSENTEFYPHKPCLEDMIIIYKYLTDLHTKVRHEPFKELCGGVRKS